MAAILKSFNRCDYYVGIWSLYMLQGLLYPSGIINRLLQLIMILWGIIICFRYVFLKTYRPRILNATALLIFMYIIYGIIYIIVGNNIITNHEFPTINRYWYLQSSLNSLLPLFVFYDFTHRGLLNENRIKKYMFVFLMIFTLLFIRNSIVLATASVADDNVNNVAYMFVTLVPFLFYQSKKPLLQYAIIVFLSFVIILGMKRGAILIYLFSLIYFLITSNKDSSSKLTLTNIFLTLIFVFVVSFFVKYRLETSDTFTLRIEQTTEGMTSGRSDIFASVWHEVSNETNFHTLLLGRGANSTIAVAGNYAHNDWLEIACNNGILGVMIFCIFFISLFRLLPIVKRKLPRYYSKSLILVIIFMVMKPMFSMLIQNMELSVTLLLGYIASKAQYAR